MIKLSNQKALAEKYQHKNTCMAFNFAVKSGSRFLDFSLFAAWPEFHSLSSADRDDLYWSCATSPVCVCVCGCVCFGCFF